jgi:His/Glu/Gln/Arg/opine family amino acid ABC transporter permease subunit
MPTVLINFFPYMLQGAVVTFWLALVCVSLGTILGVTLGILSVLAKGIIRWPITAYVFVIRGIPVLVQMFLAYYALPVFGIVVNIYVAVGGALVLYIGAFVTEIIRGAILSVPRDQIDAAKSIGMRPGFILIDVILPQAFKMSLPPLANNSVMMIKATAFASIVGVWELTYAAKEIVESTLAAFEVFSGAMVLYFLMCYPLTILAQRLEKRYAYAN